jgi:hypothetical protein
MTTPEASSLLLLWLDRTKPRQGSHLFPLVL